MSIGNIFCDASMDIKRNIGCAGVYLVSEDFKHPIDYYYIKQYNATNNSAEILAIYHAILMALYYRNRKDYNFDKFRVFSDSKICIYGLREWIYAWVNNQNENGVLKRSDNEPVLNQYYFKEIVRLILDNNLKVSFIHQKGHVSFSKSAIEKSKKFFYETNGFSPEDIGTNMRYINAYNSEVDMKSRELLYNNIKTHIEYENPLTPLILNSEMIKFNDLTHWI